MGPFAPVIANAQQQSAGQAVRFNIPAQPLSSAIAAFVRKTGWEVGFTSQAVAGKRSAPVTGAMAPAQALRTLLAGTGVSVRISGPFTAALVAGPAAGAIAADGATVLETITVEGRGESAWGPVEGIVARRSGTASKTDAALIETPQSISVVSRDQIDQQSARTVSESLRYTPGVLTGTAGLQSRRFDPVFVRGFGGFSAAATYAQYLDGLKWHHGPRTSIQIDSYLLERVETFRGPSSVLYGQATPGGFVNMVSKRPSDVGSHEVYTSVGSYGRVEGGFDSTGPLNEEGTLLYRLIGLGRLGETQVDYQNDERAMIAPSLTWTPEADTTLIIQAMYQRDPRTSDAGFLPPIGTVLPGPYGYIPRDFFQGDPNYNHFERSQASIGYQFEHRFDETWKFRQNLRFGYMEDDIKSVNFQSLAADGRTINRNASYSVHKDYSFSVDNQIQAEFSTGGADHTFLAGLDYQRYRNRFNYGQGLAGPIDWTNPVYGIPITPVRLTFDRKEPFDQLGIYAQDQISYGNWRLWLSGRHDWAESRSQITNMITGANGGTSEAESSAFTGRIGLLYLFDNGLAPYVSYSTSFEPALGMDYHHNALKPMTGEQVEAGLKFEPEGYDASVTLSAFHITKNNVTATDPDPTHVCPGLPQNRCVTQNGEVASKGFEAEIRASVLDGLDLIAAYSFTDVEVVKSDTAAFIGKRPVGVPEHMASLWASYTFGEGALEGLTLGGGVRYVGSSYGTDTNLWGAHAPGYERAPSKVPGYTLVDLALGYDFGKRDPSLAGLRLDVKVNNVFDEKYVAACNGYGSCVYGEGRSALATLKYRW
ncbi:TonB-dependent siderophore receptor [Shinella sp. BYT-45]|uniref:TonB-dependent siderophore receptor n=1 Tax=Shinella sp. BYT-45 TaxID=3377377 RepID=UPI0039810F5E